MYRMVVPVVITDTIYSEKYLPERFTEECNQNNDIAGIKVQSSYVLLRNKSYIHQ